MAIRLPMKSQGSARKTLARLIREFYRGEIPVEQFRALAYGMSVLLQYFRLDIDAELSARLDEIESAIEADKARLR